jgi:hypothetical protein
MSLTAVRSHFADVPARFIEPMLLQLTPRLPEGAQWLYELKLDGYPKFLAPPIRGSKGSLHPVTYSFPRCRTLLARD